MAKVGGEAVRRVALVPRDRHAAAGLGVYGIAVEAVGDHAHGDSGAVQRRSVGAHGRAALREVALRGHRPGARARHRGAHRDHLGAAGRGLELIDGEPAADVVGIHRGMLQPEAQQRGFQLLRIAARGRIDEDQRCAGCRGLVEPRRGTQGMQVRQHMIGPCQRRMARQIGEHRIEFDAGGTVALRSTAGAGHVQTRVTGGELRLQRIEMQRSDSRGCRDGTQHGQRTKCQET